MSNGPCILLVRHGESTWNAAGRWQGQADPPLTDRGRDQARSAARRLPPVAAVVASDLQRARETAEILAGPQEQAVVVDGALRERDAGAFSGLTRTDIHARHPGLLPDDPSRTPGTEGDGLVPPPGWEPDAALARRAWEAIERVATTLGGSSGASGLVVTHSGLIYAVEATLGGERHRIANLEGRELHHGGRRWTLGPRRLLLDAAADDVTSPDGL